ncbi:tyrosine-type recombinase/integrase [Luteococcus sp.]|uniref:tyrosine-type recombinase/integrase n=1 Tax=Luteococcus sp. TaxID=1969402 RepID=UPI00373554B8
MSRQRRGRGEGAVYKTETGTWRGAVDFGWKDGTRHRKYVSARTKAEAQQKIRELTRLAEEGRIIPGRVPTLEAWMNRYLDEVAAPTVRPSTLNRYRQETRLYIVPNLGRVKLDKLTPQHISDFYRTMLKRLAAGSVRRLHALLRRALTVAVRWKIIPTNPVLSVDPPSIRRAEITPWSLDETKSFLTFVENRPMAARWQLGVALGMRQGEVLGLSWSDIDFEGRTLRISKALQYQPGAGLRLVEPKTAQSRRTVALPDHVVTSLEKHREDQEVQRQTAGDSWIETGLVFTTSHGTPYSPRNDYRTFKTLVAQAGLPEIRLHDLRHTAASNMLTRGVQARVVMETLGHSQISLTMNTYSHVAPNVSRDAADVMGEALWASDPELS